jgi:hypothetical protein
MVDRHPPMPLIDQRRGDGIEAEMPEDGQQVPVKDRPVMLPGAFLQVPFLKPGSCVRLEQPRP